MLLRGQGRCPGFTAERKSSPFEASFGSGMRHPATLAIHVLSAAARGDLENGK